MGMNSDAFNLIQKIYGLKGNWESADKAGDKAKAEQVAQSAQPYYKQLENLGYSGVADELSKANYEESANVLKHWGMKDKSSIRPYFYNQASKYGMSQDQIDNLLNYNETTGEVNFAGKNLGSPFAEVDGRTYWDPNYLQKEFEEGMKRTGNTLSEDYLYKQGQSDVSDRIAENWGMMRDAYNTMNKKAYDFADYQQNTNPFETDIGKSILERYDLKGMQGRDNEAAAGAGSNGGNIDSYSAANALKRQAYLRNMGEQTVIADWQSRMSGVQKTLDNLGLYNQGIYDRQQNNINLGLQQNQQLYNNEQDRFDRELNRDETKKNGQVSRDVTIMDTTGIVLPQYSNNPYIGANFDIQDKINELVAQGKDPNTDPEINQLKEARAYKIKNSTDPAIRNLSYDTFTPTSQQTKDFFLNNKQIDSAENIATNQSNNELEATKNTNETELAAQNAELGAQKYEIDTTKQMNDDTLALEREKMSGGIGNKGGIDSYVVADAEVKKWAEHINTQGFRNFKDKILEPNDDGTYNLLDKTYGTSIARDIMSQDTLTQDQKIYILNRLGVDPDTINKTINSPYRQGG